MRNFFEEMAPWERNDGSLHLYALPDDDLNDHLDDIAAQLDGVAHLPTMPRAWRHFTVRRLAQFDDLGQAGLSRLADAITEELGTVRPFELHVHAPTLGSSAVELPAAPSSHWDHLVDVLGRAAISSLGGELPPPPAAPHLTVAYATGDVEEAEVRKRLADVAPVGDVAISTVHLVSVTMRPELGWFDWVELANWPL